MREIQIIGLSTDGRKTENKDHLIFVINFIFFL
jgi:hypothetical protein